jgi:hypothetical protein
MHLCGNHHSSAAGTQSVRSKPRNGCLFVFAHGLLGEGRDWFLGIEWVQCKANSCADDRTAQRSRSWRFARWKRQTAPPADNLELKTDLMYDGRCGPGVGDDHLGYDWLSSPDIGCESYVFDSQFGAVRSEVIPLRYFILNLHDFPHSAVDAECKITEPNQGGGKDRLRNTSAALPYAAVLIRDQIKQASNPLRLAPTTLPTAQSSRRRWRNLRRWLASWHPFTPAHARPGPARTAR